MAWGYVSARRRDLAPLEIFGYWRDEAGDGGYHVDPERGVESLRFLWELVAVP